MRRTLKECISDLFLGLGFIFIISPGILLWFIHGNYERYLWIINGPYPWSHFGGGPFQLFLCSGLLMLGIVSTLISVILKK